jgi:hypothetical protein
MTTIAVTVLQAMAEFALQQCAVVQTNTLDDWKNACRAGTRFVAISQYPSPDLCKRIELLAIPVIIVAGNPLQSLTHLLYERHSGANAVRAISASFSCLAHMLRQGHVEIEAANAENMTAFFVRLTELSGVNSNDLNFERAEERAAELTSEFDIRRAGETEASLVNRTLAKETLSQLGHLEQLGTGASIGWPGSAFLLGDFPDTPMRGSFDLTGPARCVLYGPYLHLPPGYWNVSMVIGLSRYEGRQMFAVEVVCDEVVAKGCFCAHGAGLHRVDIEFLHCNPHVPVELRIFLSEGAIDGFLDRFDVSLILSEAR